MHTTLLHLYLSMQFSLLSYPQEIKERSNKQILQQYMPLLLIVIYILHKIPENPQCS